LCDRAGGPILAEATGNAFALIAVQVHDDPIHLGTARANRPGDKAPAALKSSHIVSLLVNVAQLLCPAFIGSLED
jgi:hypothetical protein